MATSGDILGIDLGNEYALGEHIARSEKNPEMIFIDNHYQIRNLNPRNVMKALLHELGHAISGDDLDSRAEELLVESVARALAEEVSGEKVFEYSLEYFISAYKGYPAASPGTNGIPSGAGITTKFEPESVVMEGNILTITSPSDESGYVSVDTVTYGSETDADGNPMPISAVRTLKNPSGEVVFTHEYGAYNPVSKSFAGRAKVLLKQSIFENSLNPNRENLFGIK